MHHELTPQQHQAVELLISGEKLCNIANQLNIERQTLWRWRQEPEFRHALKRSQELQREALRHQVDDILRLALLNIQHSLSGFQKPKGHPDYSRAFDVLERLPSLPIFKESGKE